MKDMAKHNLQIRRAEGDDLDRLISDLGKALGGVEPLSASGVVRYALRYAHDRLVGDGKKSRKSPIRSVDLS